MSASVPLVNDLAAPIFDHAATPRLPKQFSLERQLDAFQTFVIKAGKSDDVCGHFAAWVEAAIFLV